MPKAFDGFSFDLFAYFRRHQPVNSAPHIPQSHEDGAPDEQDERLRRQQEDAAFWGLVAFPVL